MKFKRLICGILVCLIAVSAIAVLPNDIFADDGTLLLTKLDESRITYSKDIFAEKDQTIRKNSNDFGQGLCVAGVKFSDGFFTHASNSGEPTQITVDISGLNFKYFKVQVGIDDGQGNNGSCRFYILGDGKILCKTDVLRNGDSEPKTLVCSVDGISTLILRVDNGGDGYASDWGVWGNPTLCNDAEIPEEAEVKITSPSDGAYVTDGRITVSGTCTAGDSVVITCGGESATVTQKDGRFEQVFNLKDYGSYEISAVLRSKNKDVASCNAKITYTKGDIMLLTKLDEARIKYSEDIFDEKDQTIRKNSNDFGQGLCVAGVNFAEGFFTHASNTDKPTQITFDISGLNYKYFGVRVGIDDGQGNNGSCRFYILGDGKVLCSTPVIYNYDESPTFLSCNIEGVSELILRVDDGGDGYNSDWGVWGEPTLYKSDGDVPVFPEIKLSLPISGMLITDGKATVSGICKAGDGVIITCGGETATVTPEDGRFEHTFSLTRYGVTEVSAVLKSGSEEVASAQTGFTYAKDDGVRFEISNGDTSAQIGVCGGNPALFSIKNIKTGREWLKCPSVMALPASVGGETAEWTYTGSKNGKNGDFTTLTLLFKCNICNITADSTWEYTDGGIIRHYITLNNPGSLDVCVTYAPTFSGILDGNLTLFTVARGGGTPGDTGTWTDGLSDGTAVRILDSRIPIAFISDGSERIAIAHTFGTGEIDVTGISNGASVESGLGNTFKTDIPAGDGLLVPASFFATGNGTQDEFSNYLNAWLYSYNTPNVIKEETWPHVMFNMWNSLGGADPKGTNFRRTCDAAVALGIDRIVLDYGWWDKLGEWDPSPKKWKNGMAQYGQYAKESGLEYVMYFLFHNGNSTQEGALSALTHPEWFVGNGAIDEICDLGNEECVDYIKTTLASKLNEFGIPGYRSDFSPVALSSDRINRHKYGVDTAYWNYIGFYEILTYLQENVPGFTYENCCGGGYYKDYATMSYTSNIFSTDTYRVIDARRSFYDTSFCYPACQIAPQISFSNDNPAIWDSFALREQMTYGYIYRSVMLGAMYVNLDSPAYKMDEEESAFLARQIQIYKQWIRPLVVNADLYHTTERPDNINWDATQYYDPDTGKGILYVFRPDNNIDSATFKLYGLDPNANYYVRSEENRKTVKYTGAELLENGITVSCDRIYWSDLLYIQRTDVEIDTSNIAWEGEALELENGGTEAETTTAAETSVAAAPETEPETEPDENKRGCCSSAPLLCTTAVCAASAVIITKKKRRG